MQILKLKRLNEQDSSFPQEILNITIGERLNKVKPEVEIYSSIQDILVNSQSLLTGDTYPNDNKIGLDRQMEVEEEPVNVIIDSEEKEDDDLPTFDSANINKSSDSSNNDSNNLDNYSF
jgi:hypothetical protein